jgi:glycosyltransferase involved in cell wall biosynthesis
MSGRPRVNLLLEDTALFGGVKVTLQVADLLHRRGHAVTVVSRGPRPDWFPLEAPFVHAATFSPAVVPPADVNLATYWTTIGPSLELPGQALHYCQGFEGAYTHNLADHPAIEAAYATAIPALAVAPHLVELLRSRFGRPARLLPPAVTPCFRPRPRLGPGRSARVLVMSPFEVDWKGVPTALAAVRRLRERGLPVRLVRLSQWPLSAAEEALLRPDEFHHHLQPEQVARLLAGCDLLLAPSREQEGFGLPVLEAMACGVPVVASAISSFSWYASGAAELVAPEDVEGFARAAAALLTDRGRWRRMRRAGLRVARAFAEATVADAAVAGLAWAASGAWRDEA